MKISLPFLDKKETLSYFLVLVLRNNKASAVIFEEAGGTIKVVNQASESFADSIESASEEDFLDVLDKAISKAESILSDNVETQKTIFGVKEGWVEDSRIKKEYLAKLKKASDELDLVPIGFLITTEAIAHLLAKEEGAPVSAILAEVDRDYVSVSLIRAGKVVETKTSKLEGKAPDTVDTLLKHFENVEVFPSRVIIFGADIDLTQDFISHAWSKTLPFLHLPQISNLEQGFDAKAVLSGAASEMGFQVLGESPREGKAQEETPAETNEAPKGEEEVSPVEEETIEKKTSTAKSLEESDSFGFIKEQDIADVRTSESMAPEQEAEDYVTTTAGAIQEIPQELQVEQSESKPLSSNASILLTGAKKVLGKVLAVTRRSASKRYTFSKGNKFTLLPLGIFVIFVVTLILYFFGRSAVVTLNIDARKISQTRDVTFSPVLPTDASKNIIAAQFVDITENGSVSTNATGKKDIGTPAKGTVTMFNNGDGSVTFPKGTIITSSNNLKFTLDKDILVASPSGDASNPSPGTANVSVTANDIGTQQNLPSNTKFSVGTNPLAVYAAKNDNPFSGGTKKSITVVSSIDIAKLESDLAKNLEEKAKDDIVKKISGEKILLPVFASHTLSKKDFNKKEGDEASQVTLKADVNFKSIAYSKSDMVSFAKEALKEDISNLALNEGGISTDVREIKKVQGNDVLTSLEISGLLLPRIEQQNLAKEISGKSTKFAENFLTSIGQVSSATVKISPNIPLLPKNLPGAGKIKFEIKSNE
ncbi:MAG: baseplate J/gp47 family protein [Candidatus Levybacteria bacterium]|nr:baseplate J/gp47 family protein [Candidatus Levybacteria bacterium]